MEGGLERRDKTLSKVAAFTKPDRKKREVGRGNICKVNSAFKTQKGHYFI